MRLKQFEKRLIKDPAFEKELKKRDLAEDVARLLIEARVIKGITQAKLAKMIGTKQPSIARVENGNYLPSLSFLDKVAKAFNTHVTICFDFMKDKVEGVSSAVDAKTTGSEPLVLRKWTEAYPREVRITYDDKQFLYPN